MCLAFFGKKIGMFWTQWTYKWTEEKWHMLHTIVFTVKLDLCWNSCCESKLTTAAVSSVKEQAPNFSKPPFMSASGDCSIIRCHWRIPSKNLRLLKRIHSMPPCRKSQCCPSSPVWNLNLLTKNGDWILCQTSYFPKIHHWSWPHSELSGFPHKTYTQQPQSSADDFCRWLRVALEVEGVQQEKKKRQHSRPLVSYTIKTP